MTTYYRGVDSITEEFAKHVKQLENRLANDNVRAARKEQHMTRLQRENTNGQIQGLNFAIGLLHGARVLTPEEYDKRFSQLRESQRLIEARKW